MKELGKCNSKVDAQSRNILLKKCAHLIGKKEKISKECSILTNHTTHVEINKFYLLVPNVFQ